MVLAVGRGRSKKPVTGLPQKVGCWSKRRRGDLLHGILEVNMDKRDDTTRVLITDPVLQKRLGKYLVQRCCSQPFVLKWSACGGVSSYKFGIAGINWPLQSEAIECLLPVDQKLKNGNPSLYAMRSLGSERVGAGQGIPWNEIV